MNPTQKLIVLTCVIGLVSPACKKAEPTPDKPPKAQPAQPAKTAAAQPAVLPAVKPEPKPETKPEPVAPAPTNKFVEVAALKACLAGSELSAEERSKRLRLLMKGLQVTEAAFTAAEKAYANDARVTAALADRTDPAHCARELSVRAAKPVPAAPPKAPQKVTAPPKGPSLETRYIEAEAQRQCLTTVRNLSDADRKTRFTAFLTSMQLTEKTFAQAAVNFAANPNVATALKERTTPEACLRELGQGR